MSPSCELIERIAASIGVAAREAGLRICGHRYLLRRSPGNPGWPSLLARSIQIEPVAEFLLNDRNAVVQPPSGLNLSDFQLHQVAGPQFAVDCQIEKEQGLVCRHATPV